MIAQITLYLNHNINTLANFIRNIIMLYDHARISDHRYRYLNILDSRLVQGIDLLMLMGEVSCNLFFDVIGK